MSFDKVLDRYLNFILSSVVDICIPINILELYLGWH